MTFKNRFRILAGLVALLFVALGLPVWAHDSNEAPASESIPIPEGMLVGTTMHLKGGDVHVPAGWTWTQLPGSGEPQYMGMPSQGRFRAIVLMSSRRRVLPKRYIEEFNKSFARSLGKDVLPQAVYSDSDKPFLESLKATLKFMDLEGHTLASGLSYIGGRTGNTLAVTGVGVEAPTKEVEQVLASFSPRPLSTFESLLDILGQVGFAVCGVAIGALVLGTSRAVRVVGAIFAVLCLLMVAINWISGGVQAAAVGVGSLLGGCASYLVVYNLLVRRKRSRSCNN